MGIMAEKRALAIGDVSRRTGLSVTAIRFYEERGLLSSFRTQGNQRRLERSEIRRLSFAVIVQQLGLTLTEIEAELSLLSQGRTPTRADWQSISSRIRGTLDAKIAQIERTRELLDGVSAADASRWSAVPSTTQAIELPGAALDVGFCSAT